METIECSKCGAIFEKTGAKDKLRRFKDKRFMTTFHCPNCDARVILKNGDEPITMYLKRLERLKEQARRLGDNQEVNELQDEIDQINREIKMNAGKTRDKKFSMKGKDAYDPTKPKNIAKAKALSVAQGKAASDEEAYDPLDPENILKEKELAKARGAAAADVKDALFKGQKVTAIKSEQGLREGEVYTVLGEEAIIKQIVGENDTTVYKLQDSSGNVIVIESPEGLFYEVLDAYDDGYEAAKNGKPISDNPFKDRSRSGWGDFKESWDDGWRDGNKNKDSKTKDKEEENESLKVKIGEIKKNMDAARKMGYDTEPYQKEIDKLEVEDEERDQTGAETQEIAKNYRKLNRGFAEYDPEFAKVYFKNKKKTKDDNSKNGYYAAMTGKARTDNPFTKGTPEYTKWDSDWKIGSEDFKYESNKELFKPKDSDDKELKEMLVNDAPDYYGAIVATARRGNNPQMGSKEVRKNLEPFMSAHGVQFNEEEFNKAYKEFNKAGVSKAAFMKGTDAADVYTKDPLTKKGEKILAAMKKVYGEEKGEQVFYASKNKGTISGVDGKTKDEEVHLSGSINKDKSVIDRLLRFWEGQYSGQTDKGAIFKFKNESDANGFRKDIKKQVFSVFVDSKTKDQEIKIIIGDDPVTPSPAEQKVEGNDVIYKEYTLKQLPETGEFEVYAPGGSIVGHAKALELAKLFVDRIVASRVGDEWSEEARKKL